MRILFFPNDSGGGFGHISMCLALAEEAKKQDHECAFVLSKKKFLGDIKREFKVFFLGPKYRLKDAVLAVFSRFSFRRTVEPVFTEISKIDYLFIRDGLMSERKMKDRFEEYLSIARTFKPSVLVGDTDLLVRPLSQKISRPVVQIVRYLTYPLTAKLIWWKDVPENIRPPEAIELVDSFLDGIDLPRIKAPEGLLAGDLYIVPSVPDIEPIPSCEQIRFVGALRRKANADVKTSRMLPDDGRPEVYMTIGAGAGGTGNKRLFMTVIEAFRELPVNLTVSTSANFNLKEFSGLPANIKFFNWVPGSVTIERSDLVIFHGGHATMMEVLSYGKPSIVIPFQTEQESNGRRLEQLGCAKVLKLSKGEYKQSQRKWEYGQYNYLFQESYDLTAEELADLVRKVLTDEKYRRNAQTVRSKIEALDGAAGAMNFLEKKLQDKRWGGENGSS